VVAFDVATVLVELLPQEDIREEAEISPATKRKTIANITNLFFILFSPFIFPLNIIQIFYVTTHSSLAFIIF
jgi:hypothetical protein